MTLVDESLRITFPRRRDAVDLSYSTKGTTSLNAAWHGGTDFVNWLSNVEGAEFDTLVVADKIPPTIAPKSFLHLEVTHLPVGATFPAPFALSLTPTASYDVALRWKLPSQDASEILIERFLPDSGAWFSIGAVVPTVNFFEDQGLGPGMTYTYRVKARNSVNASTSASSVSVTTPPDLDGDGVSDEDEDSYGTNPNNIDTDGDGLTDGAEIATGTSPTDSDTDHDGTPDGDDMYANDPLRSRPIPFATYGKLDLSLYDSTQNYATWVAINDLDSAAYGAGADASQPSGGARSFAWNLAGDYKSATQAYVEMQGGTNISFEVNGVTALGQLFGFASNETRDLFSFTRPVESSGAMLAQAPYHPYTLQVSTCSDSGPMHGSSFAIFPSAPGSFEMKTFTGSVNTPQLAHSPITIIATSQTGNMVGMEIFPTDPDTGETQAPAPVLWSGGSIDFLPFSEWPSGVNDSLDIIGGEGSSAFYYSNGVKQSFPSLIPGEFLNQLQGIRPIRISNRVDDIDFPLIEFTASSLEEVPPKWVSRVFQLTKNKLGETSIAAQVAATGKDVPSQQINKKGTGIGINDEGNATLLPKVEWRESFVDFYRGFDAPMAGDVDPLTGADFDTKKPENRYTWASVTKGGTSDKNENIRAWFTECFKIARA